MIQIEVKSAILFLLATKSMWKQSELLIQTQTGFIQGFSCIVWFQKRAENDPDWSLGAI